MESLMKWITRCINSPSLKLILSYSTKGCNYTYDFIFPNCLGIVIDPINCIICKGSFCNEWINNLELNDGLNCECVNGLKNNFSKMSIQRIKELSSKILEEFPQIHPEELESPILLKHLDNLYLLCIEKLSNNAK